MLWEIKTKLKMEIENIFIKKLIKPTLKEMLMFRKLARQVGDNLKLSERFKIFMAFSYFCLFWTAINFNHFFIAVDLNNRLVGFAIVRKNLLRALFVRVGYQRRGVGKRLLRFVEFNTSSPLYLRASKSSKPFYLKNNFLDCGGGLMKKNEK